MAKKSSKKSTVAKKEGEETVPTENIQNSEEEIEDLTAKVPNLDITERYTADFFGMKKTAENLCEKSMKELFELGTKRAIKEESQIIIEDQYKEAIELIMDADAAGLYPVLVGPPGVGKTAICRYYSKLREKMTGVDAFEWMTFDEATKPAHLSGSFNPALTLEKGFSAETFSFGPLTRAMLVGGIFLANEINRATEYTQNSLLEPLEEGTINIPHLGRIKAAPGFFFIGAMNPSEIAGTHRIADALKDRLKVWIQLDYPKRNTEIKIIKANNPFFQLKQSDLDKIYSLIHATRESPQIEIPASLRAAIGIARLVGIEYQKKNVNNIEQSIANIAFHVLSGSIKPKPGLKADQIVKDIIKAQIGVTL
jgi:MoxR-like ATPase